MSDDWWAPSQSTSHLSTPTPQPASSDSRGAGTVQPLVASTSSAFAQPSSSLSALPTFGFGAASNSGNASAGTPARAQPQGQHEFIDELDEEDAKLADHVNFGPAGGASANGSGVLRGSFSHGYTGMGMGSPGRLGGSTGYIMGTPGGPSSPGGGAGYASSPLAGVAGIGSPGGKRSPGSRFGGGMDSASSPREQRRRAAAAAAHQDEDLPPSTSLRETRGGNSGDGAARDGEQDAGPSNYNTPRSANGGDMDIDHDDADPNANSQAVARIHGQVQGRTRGDTNDDNYDRGALDRSQRPQIGRPINIIQRDVLRVAPPTPARGSVLSAAANGVVPSATGASTTGGVGAGGAGQQRQQGWSGGQSLAGKVLGMLITGAKGIREGMRGHERA